MIAFRDILIFAGLAALAAAVIASLFPAGEVVTPVPACSDCAFKLTGGYWIRQYDNYAALYLGTREAARYGWAYIDGFPLGVGEIMGCDPMYVHVLGGVAYISCRGGDGSTFGRRVPNLPPWVVEISADPSKPGCTYTVDAAVNEGATIWLYVYDENGRLVYSVSSTSPATFTFSPPVAGTYRMRIYAPPLLDQWYTLYARVSITASKAAVYTSNNTQDLRSSIALKIFDLTNYWKRGYASVTVRINPAGSSFTLSAPTGAFADYLLAWEDCRRCSCDATADLYKDEVWRLTFTPSGPVLTRIYSQGGYWHEVYADGKLIYTWNKQGPKNDRYTGSDPTISVKFVSQDSTMNAEAAFTKVCAWR
jgi:hypothetical protein